MDKNCVLPCSNIAKTNHINNYYFFIIDNYYQIHYLRKHYKIPNTATYPKINKINQAETKHQ